MAQWTSQLLLDTFTLNSVISKCSNLDRKNLLSEKSDFFPYDLSSVLSDATHSYVDQDFFESVLKFGSFDKNLNVKIMRSALPTILACYVPSSCMHFFGDNIDVSDSNPSEI